MHRALNIFWILTILLSFCPASYAGIQGSKHDLTSGSTGPSNPSLLGGDNACVYCHAPHIVLDPPGQPLWNRSDPVTTNFEMYGRTMKGTSTDASPNQASLRCLSCHDGVTAVDAFGGGSGTSWKTLDSPYDIAAEGNLSDDHPVSIGTSGMSNSLAAAEAAGLVFYESGGVRKVECPTCHDPHDGNTRKFLRVSNDNSALCSCCHDK